ncbi:hypothetical protein [Actinacidiphila yeochonensis]|uniref:hypothetical protein n=1 Tax=Actinacidiphila yeochonensis TaxID=89050 RepID=UPI0012FEFB1C|nr:hypothetical protein [Actinacidiphila yeochonensis]
MYFNTGEHLVLLGTDGKYEDVSGRQAGEPGPEDRGLSGLVVRGDGSMVVGENGQVVSVASDGQLTVLAGTAGKFRSLTASVPKSAAAADFRFARGVTPLGVEKDGTVVVADGGAVWSLSGGRLTLRYRQAALKSGAQYVSPFLGAHSAADPDGTVFLNPGDYSATLAEVVVVPGDGQGAHKLTLPAKVPGLGVATAELLPASLAGDGADGVYINAFNEKKRGSYVLHVHDGRVDLVASTTATATSPTCGVHKAVAARDFPCYFPDGIAYRAGHVYLAGNRSYVLDIGVGRTG